MIIIKFLLFWPLIAVATVIAFAALLIISPVGIVVAIGLALGKQDYGY